MNMFLPMRRALFNEYLVENLFFGAERYDYKVNWIKDGPFHCFDIEPDEYAGLYAKPSGMDIKNQPRGVI